MEAESLKLSWLQTLFLRKLSRDTMMDAYITCLVKELQVGRILSVQSYGATAKKVRSSLTTYIQRYARLSGDPEWQKWQVWSSHQGLIVRDSITGQWGIAESTPERGAAITPWADYERDIRSGKCKVRLYEVLGASSTAGAQAQANWIAKVKGTVYDYLAYIRLTIKTLFIDLSDISPTNWFTSWLKSIGDRAAGWKWANWCTEGVGKSYVIDPPAIDIYQTLNPTPATHEQVAGELPRHPEKKTTLRLIEIPL